MEEHQIARYERGRTLMQLNRPEAAIEAFGEALTGEPADGYGLALIGQCHYLLEQLPAAQTSLEAALEKMPDYFYAHYLLGMTFLRTGKQARALKHFDTALDLEPESKLALLGKAKYFTILQLYPEAERFVDKALATDPDFIDALQLKSVLLGQRGEGAEAERVAALALQQDPRNPQSLRAAGYASDVGGNLEAAEVFYGESLRADPSPEAAYQYLESKAKASTQLVTSKLQSGKMLFVGFLVMVPVMLISGWLSSSIFDGFLIVACLAAIVLALVPYVHIAYTSRNSFGKVMVFKDWHQMRSLLHFVGGVLCYGLYLCFRRDVFFSAAFFFFVYGLLGLGVEVLSGSGWRKLGFLVLGLAYVFGAINFVLDFTSFGSVRLISQGLVLTPAVLLILSGLFLKSPAK